MSFVELRIFLALFPFKLYNQETLYD